ncbi:adenylate/guanylate cyclase domain-containing protein [Nocardia blacklockiae]|uniref:adenylate/guanylate cyclase domain-containing protein n=1 Tax=Nocardia blacklockiae TaxID=480036 RepID=UPI001895F759|nr:adenylate/guanylate cyclase domain-containing protein [Nocardia blacklockiae]MBF6169999.1 adenylate/guanylate cyclase domain-containing protein [Nocardia blacklockiae]
MSARREGTALPLLPGFGEPARYTAGEAAAAVGIPLVQARQYWRALGYPPIGDAVVAFGASDVQLLRTISGYVSEGILTEADTLRLTRVLTRAIAHLAHLQVEILASQQARARAGGIDVVAQMRHRMPEVQRVLGQIWVRQLAGAIHAFETDPDPDPAAAVAVGFADIVDFTELSRRRSESELTRIVGRFEFRSTQVIFESGGSVVKTLGDEVLFTARDAGAVADIATRLIAQFATDPDIPGLRVGVALGPVIRYLGDIFGLTVNLASRLTALADPDTVLAAPAVAEALADHPDFRSTPLPVTEIRGVGTVAPVRIDRR